MEAFLDTLKLTSPAPLSIYTVLVNLVLAALLAYILGGHFIRFGATFSNRRKFAAVLPAIALSTALIIMVVKVSIALSLGLVGALSIVRFRTPVKEPEELAYLFLAVAIGLGMGADQRLVTIAALALILIVLTIRGMMTGKTKYPNLYLNFELDSEDANETLPKLHSLISGFVTAVDMRRFDVRDGRLTATFFLECPDTKVLMAIQQKLAEQYPQAAITFVEQSTVPVL